MYPIAKQMRPIEYTRARGHLSDRAPAGECDERVRQVEECVRRNDGHRREALLIEVEQQQRIGKADERDDGKQTCDESDARRQRRCLASWCPTVVRRQSTSLAPAASSASRASGTRATLMHAGMTAIQSATWMLPDAAASTASPMSGPITAPRVSAAR